MRIGPVEAAIIALAVIGLLVMVVGRRRGPAPHVLLERLFDEPSKPTPGTKARVWALGVLNEAGVDADADPVYAMKVLREADPRLTPDAARVLVGALAT
ncbi:MAG: hypothetical protein ACLGHZ_08470 [Actinomycetes bacterium]